MPGSQSLAVFRSAASSASASPCGSASSVAPGSSSAGQDGDARDLEDRQLGEGLARPGGPLPVRGPGQAGAARGCRPLRGPPDDERLVLLEDPQPDRLDLVAEGRRPLEVELAGRRPHLGLHPADELLDRRGVLEGQRATGELLRARTCTRRGLGDGPEPLVEVVDLLDDRRRLDPLLDVVRLLDARAGGSSPRSRPPSTRSSGRRTSRPCRRCCGPPGRSSGSATRSSGGSPPCRRRGSRRASPRAGRSPRAGG